MPQTGQTTRTGATHHAKHKKPECSIHASACRCGNQHVHMNVTSVTVIPLHLSTPKPPASHDCTVIQTTTHSTSKEVTATMVTTTVQALAQTSSLWLRLTSSGAAAAASGQFGAALAGSARHFSSTAPGSELKAALAARIPAQQASHLPCTPSPVVIPPALCVPDPQMCICASRNASRPSRSSMGASAWARSPSTWPLVACAASP